MPANYFFLKDRKVIADETMAFWFDTKGSNFSFKAGQYANFVLENPPHTDAEGNTRSFSICSSPNQKDSIMIASRMRNTAFKSSLKEIPIGTRVKVTPALGNFVLHDDASKPAVFLAGGIGITPMRSIIAYASEQKLPHQLFLFYSNKNSKATAFLQDFIDCAKKNSNFKFFPTITQPDQDQWKYGIGRINSEMIVKNVPNYQNCIYYIAGPPAMVQAMAKILVELKIPDLQIRTEEFDGY